MPSAAILNSRQSKTPICKDEWAINTVAAVGHTTEFKEWDVISSVGMFTWDFVTWLAGSHTTMLHLVVPRAQGTDGSEITDSIIRDFALAPDRVRWRFIDVAPADLNGKKWWPQRDRTVIEIANVVLPVSLRLDGALYELLYRSSIRARIDHQFEVISYDPESHHLRDLVNTSRLTTEIQDWASDWLIHWTRTCHGPWPGETKAQFFEDFMEWRDDYCRSGFRTLLRILRERLIRASAWRIGDKQAMVAFTELSPVESIPLMRWRPRWSNWAFEPYGIAIHRDLAESLGIRPVHYVPADVWRKIPPEEKPFSHSVGKTDPIWPMEREWRCAGDLDLGAIPSDALRIIVRDRTEAAVVQKAQDALVHAFMEDVTV
jgi:hypothetical protein